MFIERFSPIPKRTLVTARGRVANIDDEHNNGSETKERRKRRDRRKKIVPITFKDRRQRPDRRKSVEGEKVAQKDSKTIGTFIDIRV